MKSKAPLLMFAAFCALAGLAIMAEMARGQGETYSPKTNVHSCTWDGKPTGRIDFSVTAANTPGVEQVVGPDGKPAFLASGSPVVHLKWKLRRYGHGVTKGAYGPHSPEFRNMIEDLYGSAADEQVYDAYCTQDLGLQIAHSALGLGKGTPLNPGIRQRGWTIATWRANILEPIPRAARLKREDGDAEILEIERQIAAIEAGLVGGWEPDGYGVWRRTRSSRPLDFLSYLPGRLSTSFLGTDLVKAN